MHPIIEDLLVNILFILGPFFIFQLLWIERGHTNKENNWIYASVIGSISIILCMSFPVRFSAEWIFDLRQVPFILIMLYFGYPAGAVLLIVSLLYRFFIGGTGFYVVMITHLVMFIFIPLTKNYFHALTSKWKPVFSALIAFVSIAFSLGVATILFEKDIYQTLPIWLIGGAISGITIAVNTYLIEVLVSNIKIRKDIAKAEKANVVGQFAAAISHEVRNPLTVTKGFLQLLKDPLIPKEKKTRFINLAIKELDHAESIISDYLTFAKPSLGRREIICVKDELKRVSELIASYANIRKVNIDLQIDKECYWIKGELQLFHQCIVNLTKNGIEAMPKGGQLSIKASSIDAQVIIDIIDTGVGITKEQLERIGEPYYSTKDNGTGLGMMVVMHIVKSMRAKIDIQSNVNKGTKISLSFPKAAPDKMHEGEQPIKLKETV